MQDDDFSLFANEMRGVKRIQVDQADTGKPKADRQQVKLRQQNAATFPPITIPANSSAPTTIDRMLSAWLVLSPAICTPFTEKKPTVSRRPRMPNASRTRPISPAPIR